MIDLENIDCLIGNANFSKDYSTLINSFKCVARINTLDGLGGVRGSRIDILFISSCTNKSIRSKNFKSIIHVSPMGRENCTCPHRLDLTPINIETNRISSGTRIIHYLDSKVTNLSLFGFNWREEPKSFYHSYTGYGPHDWAAEKDLCLSIIKRNNWRLYV